MDFWSAILLGGVEGITEFLPISSTGHLVLVSTLLHIPETDFLKSFEVVIQLGAILAVVILYSRRLYRDWILMKRLFLALVPALGVGFIFYKTIRSLLASPLVVVTALFLGGLFLIIFEFMRKKEVETYSLDAVTYRQAFLIGLTQASSVIPGVSRAGATIVGGLATGLSRSAAVEFSFLLGVPTMVAAVTLDIIKNPASFTFDTIGVLMVGFFVSFVVAMITITFLLRFVRSHTFIPFGVYRLLAALLFWYLFLF